MHAYPWLPTEVINRKERKDRKEKVRGIPL